MVKLTRTIIAYSETLFRIGLFFRFQFRQLFRIDYNSEIQALKLLGIKRADLCIDIGANKGDIVQSLLRFSSNVLAFEPNPISYQILEQRFGRNPKVSLHPLGLSDEAKTLPLYTPAYGKYKIDGLSSLNKMQIEEVLEKIEEQVSFYFYKKSKAHIVESEIKLTRLDEFNLTPFFIKIDVEGHELKVLKGAKLTLEKSKPVLLIEQPNEACIAFLHEMNYQAFYFANGKLEKGQGRLNTFFVHDNLPVN